MVNMSEADVDIDVIKQAVQLACRAPSLHNSQPWRWVAEGARLDLFSEPSRIGRSSDSTGREVLISCGAVLDHLRVAMTAAGWKTNVDRFPNPNNLKHLASIRFSPLDFVTDAHRSRAAAIGLRRTDRLPYAAPSRWDSFEPLLRAAVDTDATVLTVIPEDSRLQLAQASKLSEEWRRYDSSYHAELQWWTTHPGAYQGVPPSAVVTEAESEKLDVSRHFPTSGLGTWRADTGPDRSKILVLSTYDDSHQCVLGAGETLSTVLLECTMAGLATCTLTHMIEVTAGREMVRMLTERHEMPQLLIRVGKAPEAETPPPATPRRPLDQVLEIRQ